MLPFLNNFNTILPFSGTSQFIKGRHQQEIQNSESTDLSNIFNLFSQIF